jgi:hypothetical protein
MYNKFFLHQIKHNTSNNNWDKGIVVKDTLDSAKQGYHAYLGAYAYGNNPDTDYVQCFVTDSFGAVISELKETWIAPEQTNVAE